MSKMVRYNKIIITVQSETVHFLMSNVCLATMYLRSARNGFICMIFTCKQSHSHTVTTSKDEGKKIFMSSAYTITDNSYPSFFFFCIRRSICKHIRYLCRTKIGSNSAWLLKILINLLFSSLFIRNSYKYNVFEYNLMHEMFHYTVLIKCLKCKFFLMRNRLYCTYTKQYIPKSNIDASVENVVECGFQCKFCYRKTTK